MHILIEEPLANFLFQVFNHEDWLNGAFLHGKSHLALVVFMAVFGFQAFPFYVPACTMVNVEGES